MPHERAAPSQTAFSLSNSLGTTTRFHAQVVMRSFPSPMANVLLFDDIGLNEAGDEHEGAVEPEEPVGKEVVPVALKVTHGKDDAA